MKKINFKLTNLAMGMAMVAVLAATSCKKEGAQGEAVVASADKGEAKAKASGEVVWTGSQWRATVNGVQRYLGSDYIAAINSAIGGLTAGRTVKEWVTIKNSGSSGNSGGVVKAVNMQSYTGLDFLNTTFTCNSNDLLIVPVQADRKTNIEVKNLKVRGTPRYGIWFKGCTNMIISNIDMNITSSSYGLGTRVDHSTAATRNLTMNGTQLYRGGDMNVETYGLDGFTLGDFNTGYNRGCGVLLNQSKNGTVGTVTGTDNCRGGGYATFRVANNNGPNVKCAKVYSRTSGRGFFSVSGSNNTTITTVDIANATSHGIFLEDASYTYINGGTVTGCSPNIQHVRSPNCNTRVNGQSYTAADGRW